jgi:MFS family permease
VPFAYALGQYQWVVIGYLVVIAAVLLTLGRLADMLGRKPLFLAGLAIFTLGSALCGAAPSLGVLIAARCFQGLGAAGILCVNVAMITRSFPAAERGRALGINAILVALGVSGAPPSAASDPDVGLAVDLLCQSADRTAFPSRVASAHRALPFRTATFDLRVPRFSPLGWRADLGLSWARMGLGFARFLGSMGITVAALGQRDMGRAAVPAPSRSGAATQPDLRVHKRQLHDRRWPSSRGFLLPFYLELRGSTLFARGCCSRAPAHARAGGAHR